VSINPTLAALSDHLFSISVALYSIAVVAFCAQLAFGRRPVEARELVGAGGPAVAPTTPAAPAAASTMLLRTNSDANRMAQASSGHAHAHQGVRACAMRAFPPDGGKA